MESIAVLLDIRSAHNVGSIIRSAECFGIRRVICAGITPYPKQPEDRRLPHIAEGAHSKIAKTALGAENTVSVAYVESIEECLAELRSKGFKIVAVEQDAHSVALHTYKADGKLALVFGNEPQGLPRSIVEFADNCLEITQFGTKESLNVSVAAGVVFYEISRPK